MIIGGMRAADIADEFGTPVYVTDESIVRENYRKVYEAFSKHMDTRVHYACKANSSLAILSILEQHMRKFEEGDDAEALINQARNSISSST